MQHVCSACNYCSQPSCIECAIDYYAKIYESKSDDIDNKVNIKSGNKEFLYYPFEIEKINQQSIQIITHIF